MQLNFLQEDEISKPKEPKRSSSGKNKEKNPIAGDLFSGLPLESSAKKSVTEPSIQIAEKSETAFKTISEVATILSVPQHVLRFWESRFSQIKPLKMGGGRRYYRPEDIDILSKIHNLLYKQGYTIKGAKKAFIHRDSVKQESQPATITAPSKSTSRLTDRQRKQLSVILKELTELRLRLHQFSF